MSYARFGAGGSDVYVFLDCGGHLSCCGCWLQEREWVDEPDAPLGGYLKRIGPIVQTQFATTADMLRHLDAHRAAGHTVLNETYEDLQADAEENDAWIAEQGTI